MKRIGIFFGSTTGNTEATAGLIAAELGEGNVDIKNIAQAAPDDILAYDNLIFGASTWGLGDLQDDWESFLPKLDSMDFTGKKVALYGLGDQSGYPDTFIDGLIFIYDKVKAANGEVVGFTSTKGYDFTGSKAEVEGNFVGLAIDDDSEPEKSAERIKDWTAELKNSFA